MIAVEEPDRPLAYGGRIQILGVELYSDKVSVNWRLAPLPDPEDLFVDELADQEPDLDGLSDDFKKILREKLTQRLQMQRRSLALSDDVGTEFRSTGGGSGGGGNERRGHSDFVPGVPAEAKRLIVRWTRWSLTSRCLRTGTGPEGALIAVLRYSEPVIGDIDLPVCARVGTRSSRRRRSEGDRSEREGSVDASSCHDHAVTRVWLSRPNVRLRARGRLNGEGRRPGSEVVRHAEGLSG